MTSEICPAAEYKQENSRGRSDEVVTRYGKSILGMSETT